MPLPTQTCNIDLLPTALYIHPRNKHADSICDSEGATFFVKEKTCVQMCVASLYQPSG